MKKKSLLLLIPFAAAALAGCTPATKPCSDAVISFTDGDSKTIKVGEDFQIPYSMDVEKCDGELKWESSDTAVATVDSSGKVHGVAVGTAVITVNGKTFNIKVEKGDDPHPDLKEVTPAEAIALMEEAGEGVVVQPEVIVVGTISNPTKDNYNQWYADFDNSELKLSGASYAGSESIVTGVTIKVKGYLEKFEGKYKIGYLPASASPTGEKYIPEITSVTPPQGKAVVEVVDVKSSPASVAVGGTVSPSSVTLNVKLEDGTSSTAKATKVEVDTKVAAESVEGKAWYNELGPVTFNIKVVAEAPSSMKEAYLAAEALTDSKAKTEEFTFSGVIVGKRTNKNDKGEVEFFVQDGSYAIDLFNPTNKDSLAVGNRVTITSTLCNYNGTIETTSDLKSVVVDGNADLPEATFIDSAATLSSTKVSVLANTEGVIKTIPTYSATADAKVIVTVGSDDITVFFKKNFIADFESIYKSLAVGDKITLTNGVVGDFKGRQILVIDGTQITKGETPDPGEPAINLDKYSATIAKDGEVTLTATVYNSEESVSWSVDSGEGNVAITPNGKTCVVKGVVANSSAVVKATLGTTGKSKTCNVTVKADSPVIEGIVLDFAELSEVSGTFEGVSYASDKASGASAPAYNSSNKELRLYAKNTFTISGTNITKITFDYNGCYTEGEKDPCHKATGDIVSASVGSVSAGVWTGSADSVTFTMSDSGQVHVHKVGVVCAAAKTVSELTVKTQPDKVAYNEGESFSAAGLVLHAVYSDSSEEDITSGWTIAPSGALAPTDNKVVVSYGGKSVDVDITVTARELQSIVIDTQPTKVNYVEGESFDPAGMVVKANYNVGDPAVITNYTYSPDGALELSDDKVVVSYNGKTASVDITVSEAPVVVEWVKATSIAVGDTIAFVNEENKKEMSGMASTGKFIDVVGYEDKIAHECTLSVEAGSQANTFAFKLGDNYLSYTGSNNEIYANATEVDDAASWTVSFDENGNAVITNVKTTERVIRYNANSPRFACYKGTQEAIQVYKAPSAPVDPAVNGVTVTPETATIEVEGTTQLAAVVDVVGGASQKVNWSSSNESIATVDENGLVTAVAQGTATITATSDFDKVTADSCSITVEPKSAPEIVSVTVSPDSEDIYVGDTLQLTPTVNVKGGAAQTVTYTSDKESVATVSDSGLVTGVGDGTAHITVASTVNPGKYATATITVSTRTAEHGTTENDPLNADEAYAIADKLADNAKTTVEYYIEGSVAKINSAYSSQYNNISLDLKTSDDKTFVLFRVGCTAPQAETIAVGTVVKVKALITKYVKDATTTLETNAGGTFISIDNNLTGIKISGPESIQVGGNGTYTASAVPTLASLGEVTWSIESGAEYISLPETKTGSSIEVTGVAEGTAVIKATSGDVSQTFEILVSAEAPTPTKEYTLTYTSKDDPTGLTSSPAAAGFDTQNGRAAQWSNNEGLALTTDSFVGVKKIVLTTSTNANDDAYEISCTVGGNAFGETIVMKKGNNMELVFEDDAASGAIVITYTLKGTKKSIYVKSIVITAQ